MVYFVIELFNICLGLGELNFLLFIKLLYLCGNKGILSFFFIEYFFILGDFEIMFVFFVLLGLSGGCLCFVCGVFIFVGINDNWVCLLYCFRELFIFLIGLVFWLFILRVFVFLLLFEFRLLLFFLIIRFLFVEFLLDWFFFDSGFCFCMDLEIGVKMDLILILDVVLFDRWFILFGLFFFGFFFVLLILRFVWLKLKVLFVEKLLFLFFLI